MVTTLILKKKMMKKENKLRIWNNLSLGIKLTFMYSILLALILSIIGITYYFDIRNLLLTNTASDLRARAKPIIENWLYKNDGISVSKQDGLPTYDNLLKISDRLARDLTSRDTVAIIMSKKGEIIANGKRLPEEPTPPKPNEEYLRQALAGQNEVTYTVLQGKYHTLVILIPLRRSPTSNEIVGVIQLSSPLVFLEKTIKSHSVKIVIGIIITLILGSGLGLLIVSSALRGLKRMTVTCNEISNGNLGKRVNLPHYNDEIGQLAKAFDNMVSKIEDTIHRQKRFLANAAHELRTPLTTLKGSLEVLMRGSQDDPVAVARLSQNMYREVTRLNRLCERLLDLTRIDSYTNIGKKQVNLNTLLKELYPQLQVLGRRRSLIIHEGPFVTLNADADLLKQVIIDLVDNAIKHTLDEGTISIGWELIPDGVKIWVADNGEGIPNKDIPYIFEPFFRGENSLKSNKKGTGLGLASVNAIIKAHNGRIDVVSAPDKGTTFYIILPL